MRMAAYKLVLIRHGESCWNQENRFCGWYDADLSETGVQEAKRGGEALKGEGLWSGPSPAFWPSPVRQFHAYATQVAADDAARPAGTDMTGPEVV